MPAALASALRRLGVPDEGFVDFGSSPTARHLRYMDLRQGARRRPPVADAALPEGVVEVSGKAALYVIRQELLAGPLERQRLAS